MAYATFICDYYHGCTGDGINTVTADGTIPVALPSGSTSSPAWRR